MLYNEMIWPQRVKTVALNNPGRGEKIRGEQLSDGEDRPLKKQKKIHEVQILLH